MCPCPGSQTPVHLHEQPRNCGPVRRLPCSKRLLTCMFMPDSNSCGAESFHQSRCRSFAVCRYKFASVVSTSLPQVASLTNRRNVVAAVRLLCGCCAAAVRLQSSCSWIGLTKNFKVREDDEDEVPRFIPYFGDSTSEVNAARCSTFAAVVDVAFFLQPGWRGGGTAVHERQAAH